MKLPRRNFLHLAAGAAALPAVSRFAWAQAYPTRPVRIIVGFGAGFSPDIVARLVGQRLSERLGQQFVVENRPGAAGNLATEAVVRAPPDGYTVLRWQEHGAAHDGGPRAQQAVKLETWALFAGSQGGTVAPAGGNTCAPRSVRLDLRLLRSRD